MRLTMNPFFENKSLFVQFLFLLLFICGGLIFFSCLGSLLILLFGNLNAVKSPSSLRFLQVMSSVGAFWIPAVFFSYCSDKKLFTYNTANQRVSTKLLGVVLVLAFFILPLVSALGFWNEHISLPKSMERIELWMQQLQNENESVLLLLTETLTYPVLLINILVMAIIPAIAEEFLFRGTLQPFFAKVFKNKIHLSIWITAFLFSAIHLQFYGFFPRFLLGAYLGYLAYWSHSLWLPIFAHFLHNFFSLNIDFFTRKSGVDIEGISPDSFGAYYPIIIICTVFFVIGLLFLRRMTKKNGDRSITILNH